MFIWTIVFNIVQGNIVAPLVYNRTTDIHPAIVLACIPAAAVAGILGMFLVVPALGVVATTWRSVLRVLGADDDGFPGPEEAGEDPPIRRSDRRLARRADRALRPDGLRAIDTLRIFTTRCLSPKGSRRDAPIAARCVSSRRPRRATASSPAWRRPWPTGLSEVSMPAVAQAAGVSVATVYRHFPTKQRTVRGAAGRTSPASWAWSSPRLPTSHGGVRGHDPRAVRDVRATRGRGPRAAMDSQLGDEARRAQMPQAHRGLDRGSSGRRAWPPLDEPARDRCVGSCSYSRSSGAQRMLMLTGLEARGAAEDVIWAVRALIDAERSKRKERATG